MNAPAAVAAQLNAKPDRMDEVKAVWIVLHYGPKARDGLEPPCTGPCAGWYGTGELTTPRDPIRHWSLLLHCKYDVIEIPIPFSPWRTIFVAPLA